MESRKQKYPEAAGASSAITGDPAGEAKVLLQPVKPGPATQKY
jgi:hypothetical protein